MIKMVFRVVGLLILAAMVFLAVSVWKGGDPFRWLALKSEKAGGVVREKSEEVAKEADRIKQTTDAVRGTTKKVTEGMRKTGDKIRELTGSDDIEGQDSER